MCLRLRSALRKRLAALSPALFVRVFAPSDPELGALGEEVAARHVRARGYAIVGRRVNGALGEIDVLARDRSTLVCIEVKSGRIAPLPRRRGDQRTLDLRWRPGLRLDRAQLARLHRSARAISRQTGQPARVDLVEVLLDVEARRWIVLHHPDRRRPLAPGGGRTIPAGPP